MSAFRLIEESSELEYCGPDNCASRNSQGRIERNNEVFGRYFAEWQPNRRELVPRLWITFGNHGDGSSYLDRRNFRVNIRLTDVGPLPDFEDTEDNNFSLGLSAKEASADPLVHQLLGLVLAEDTYLNSFLNGWSNDRPAEFFWQTLPPPGEAPTNIEGRQRRYSWAQIETATRLLYKHHPYQRNGWLLPGSPTPSSIARINKDLGIQLPPSLLRYVSLGPEFRNDMLALDEDYEREDHIIRYNRFIHQGQPRPDGKYWIPAWLLVLYAMPDGDALGLDTRNRDPSSGEYPIAYWDDNAGKPFIPQRGWPSFVDYIDEVIHHRVCAADEKSTNRDALQRIVDGAA